jgi:hypothetical protein
MQQEVLEKFGIKIKKIIKIAIRVLRIDLINSKEEEEILLTSLTDVFSDLYFLRWGIEENYKFYKVRIEIENFSGFSVQM